MGSQVRPAVWRIAAAAVLIVAAACSSDNASAEDASTDTPDTRLPSTEPLPEGWIYAAMLRALDALVIAEETEDGFDPDLFNHWIDADGDGCDSRAEVLIEQSAMRIEAGPNCEISGGLWVSYYELDGLSGNADDFVVDHLVPLSEASASGAHSWSAQRREEYANHLDNFEVLVVVSKESARDRGDRDPAEWLPATGKVRCDYAEAWVDLKSDWDLSVDQAGADKLRSVLTKCAGPTSAQDTILDP